MPIWTLIFLKSKMFFFLNTSFFFKNSYLTKLPEQRLLRGQIQHAVEDRVFRESLNGKRLQELESRAF